jgi:hypothetical protein
LNPNDPWASPPIPERGTVSEADIYWSVGRALSLWEYFEFHLAILFNVLSDQSIVSPMVRRAYGAVASFGGRADLLNAAADAYFAKFPDQTLKADVSKLLKTARRASIRRNDIAHGMVSAYNFENCKISDFVLLPAAYRTNRHDLDWKPTYALTAEHIRAFIRQLQGLLSPTRDLSNRIEDRHYVSEQ